MRPTDLLLVKLSSLGDIVHTFAAVSDVKRHFPDITLTWAVEEALAPLVAEHPCVDQVITVPFRRLKKQWRRWWSDDAVKTMLATLRKTRFSHAIDAQGLIKSALLMRLSGSEKKIGYDLKSAREPVAAWFYQKRIAVTPALHAITRTRRLFAQAFDYPIDEQRPEFALPAWLENKKTKNIFFFHGTTWPSKLLPESTWRELIHLATDDGYRVLMVWGNPVEHARARRLCQGFACAEVLSGLTVPQLQTLLLKSAGAISVDTGLGHLSAALGVPTLGVFGPTDPILCGMRGAHTHNLSRPDPCMRRNCDHGDDQNPKHEPCCMVRWQSNTIWSEFRKLQTCING